VGEGKRKKQKIRRKSASGGSCVQVKEEEIHRKTGEESPKGGYKGLLEG